MESNEILATSELSDNESESFYDALDDPVGEKPERKDSKTEVDVKKSLEGVMMDSSDTDEEISSLKRDESESVNENAGAEAEEKEHKFVPLHERLNRELSKEKEKKNLENMKDSDDNEEENELDPFLIDEAKLKEEQANLTEAEIEERLAQAMEKKDIGNRIFKDASYQSAIETYTEALKVCPLVKTKERSILYSNRSTAYLKLPNIEKCIKDCSMSIELDPSFSKPVLRRAECYEKTDKLDECLSDYKKLLELEPGNKAYKMKCMELERKIAERNEKLKEEMFSKLKDLGNMVLKPFGLSTGNFQFVKDENSGSYSVKFNQNSN